mgnify:FL=1
MSIVYSSAQILSKAYFKSFHRFKVVGLENVPKDQAFILASNHASFIDPPALGCALPTSICYLARDSLFRFPFGDFLKKLNSIPIHRENMNIRTVRIILNKIKDGKGLLIFPEGTRTHDGSIQKAKSGIGFILEMANVPIVPAKIIGSYKILPRGKIMPKLGEKLTVRYGVPFLIEKSDKKLERKERYSKIAEQVMSKINDL